MRTSYCINKIVTYSVIQINISCSFYPVVTMVSRCFEYYCISTEDSEGSHSDAIHVIPKLETSR